MILSAISFVKQSRPAVVDDEAAFATIDLDTDKEDDDDWELLLITADCARLSGTECCELAIDANVTGFLNAVVVVVVVVVEAAAVFDKLFIVVEACPLAVRYPIGSSLVGFDDTSKWSKSFVIVVDVGTWFDDDDSNIEHDEDDDEVNEFDDVWYGLFWLLAIIAWWWWWASGISSFDGDDDVDDTIVSPFCCLYWLWS